MKLNEQIFVVELTREEISTLTTVLHGAYKKELDELVKNKLREMRDDFGGLINVSYMGADA